MIIGVLLSLLIVSPTSRIPFEKLNIGSVTSSPLIKSNRLRLNHFEYYRDFMRLKVLVDFPGYPSLVQAAVPYNDAPVKFYKWWRKHPGEVTMNLAEKVKLFLAVERESPSALIKAHRAIIKK